MTKLLSKVPDEILWHLPVTRRRKEKGGKERIQREADKSGIPVLRREVQRNHGFTVAAIVFLPISVLILTLTKPDYGAEFWRIFRYEVYLDPFYAKRGLLVCFFLLSLVVFTRILVPKRDDAWDGDRRLTFALCLIIGFAVTSWEALVTPSPPNIYEGGGWFVVGGRNRCMRDGEWLATTFISYQPRDRKHRQYPLNRHPHAVLKVIADIRQAADRVPHQQEI